MAMITLPCFLPTSKKLMWSLGRDEYIVKSIQGSEEKNIILLGQDVHVCVDTYMVANLILLCPFKHISLD
jgi:hypothetical protein